MSVLVLVCVCAMAGACAPEMRTSGRLCGTAPKRGSDLCMCLPWVDQRGSALWTVLRGGDIAQRARAALQRLVHTRHREMPAFYEREMAHARARVLNETLQFLGAAQLRFV
eukprot:519693-Pleurochrysis_carterae.AAC.1